MDQQQHRYQEQNLGYVTTKSSLILKGHGNEADFLGFLQKLVPPRSLTLPLGESGSRYGESGSRYSNFLKFIITRLNQPINRSMWHKRNQDVMYYHH
jgi:hypothetical protein